MCISKCSISKHVYVKHKISHKNQFFSNRHGTYSISTKHANNLLTLLRRVNNSHSRFSYVADEIDLNSYGTRTYCTHTHMRLFKRSFFTFDTFFLILVVGVISRLSFCRGHCNKWSYRTVHSKRSFVLDSRRFFE